jgi:chromosome segregation ATPase
MSTAPKQARRASVLTEAVMRQAQQAREEKKPEAASADQKFPKIKENAFFQLVFADGKPEEKRSAIAKARTFTGTKEEMREREKAYEEFKEYLAYQRELMSSQIISLQDNETFGLLQTVYGGFTDRLRDFDKKIEPLTRVLTSLFNLRTNGVSFDAIDQVERDREQEKAIDTKVQAIVARLAEIEAQLKRLNDDIAYLRTQKGLFGFGDIKAEAKGQIARNEQEIERLRSEAKTLADDNSRLETERTAARQANEKLAPFANELADLRELLDLSSDEHKKRQEELMKAALDFISTSVSSVDQVRAHMGKLENQIFNLRDANGSMRGIYTILQGAEDEADGANRKLLDDVQSPPPSDDALEKMRRENRRQELEEYLAQLTSSKNDTTETLSDLTSQSIRITAIKDNADRQSEKARKLRTGGISGVADRLSAVMTSVSHAALGEASAMAEDVLLKMRESTNVIAQQQVIQNATGLKDEQTALQRAAAELEEWGQVIKTATDITRSTVDEMRVGAEDLKTKIADLADDIQKHTGAKVVVPGAEPVAADPAPAVKPLSL